MLTVKQVANLTGITVKTLHHYHKVGLLEPKEITEAGYRLYGKEELQRLQHILFYRELDFSLEDIQKLLSEKGHRLTVLVEQKILMEKNRERINLIVDTIGETIEFEESGKEMDEKNMFKGLQKEQWQEQLQEQNEYLKEEYQYEISLDDVDVEDLEETAKEAQEFMSKMAFALREGWSVEDERIKQLLTDHIAYINDNVMSVDAKTFVESAWYFLTDEFHKDMLEEQQTGLSYYLYACAVNFAD
ncbi:MerR family transcriptional regulator [Bacillus horti]|uniref:DNA-binding transcriptional MerR regulator n=1 Tax=Caldalkalibacillus horti TaxID=77523 RepID=A0ABT9W1K3_9BACI|nr:MerR family transcriptional regulator [Bacillus horti]MDQ0166725.1 DNA-binding transcriptional MerR regulator [Bacillus horti]